MGLSVIIISLEQLVNARLWDGTFCDTKMKSQLSFFFFFNIASISAQSPLKRLQEAR